MFALAESYPPRNNMAQNELSELEKRFARQFYNDTVLRSPYRLFHNIYSLFGFREEPISRLMRLKKNVKVILGRM